MKPEAIKEYLSEMDEEILLADGFDAALLGYVEIFNKTVALYDRKKCIALLMEQGCDEDSAEEHFAFNIVGAYVGEYTPAFATLLRTTK